MPAAVLKPSAPAKKTRNASGASKPRVERGLWSGEEHDKFLEGLKMYPRGPWKKIAGHVGTRSARQVQTHAQKYYEKVGRRLRGLRKDRKKLVRPEHRLDDDMIDLCRMAATKDSALPLAALMEPQSPTREIALALKAQSLYEKMAKGSAVSVKQEQVAKDEPELTTASQEESFQALLCGLQIHEPVSYYYRTGERISAEAADLAGFDASCLDFLIEVLDCPRAGSSPSATTSSSGSDSDC